MVPKIKVCGITNIKDAKKIVDADFWAMGFIFAKESKRYISFDKAKQIISELDIERKTKLIGVFINEDQFIVERYYKDLGLDYVQLHGDESYDYCDKLQAPYVKVFHSGTKIDLSIYKKAQFFLIDSGSNAQRGGTGRLSDWKQASEIAKTQKLILAGGLSPENIGKAIDEVGCYAYDLNSCLELEPGKKDHDKIDKLEKVINSYGK